MSVARAKTAKFWVIYIFGSLLISTGIKMAVQKDKEINPEKNPVVNLFRRFMPVSARFEDGKFFVKQNGRLFATPLFVVLLVVETTALILRPTRFPPF